MGKPTNADELARFNIITGRLDLKLEVYNVISKYKAELLDMGYTRHDRAFTILDIIHSRIGSIDHTVPFATLQEPKPVDDFDAAPDTQPGKKR